MSERIIRRVVIRGRVQGVGYRAFVEHMALMRSLNGWVRNRRDGSVEAVFAGPAAEVAAMIESCRRGPGAAQVMAVEATAAGAELLDLRFSSDIFSVLPTS